MSQKVRIVGVKVKGAVFLGCPTPVSPDGRRLHGPGAPTWSSNPDEVMAWLCEGFRWRFNDRRANRGRYAWEDDPADPKKRRKVTDSAGEPILVALGNDPTWESNSQVRVKHPFLAALPDLILQAPDKIEATDWFSAAKRRATLAGKGHKAGKMPRFRVKNSDARFVCLHNKGKNAVLTKTGRRCGIVTITGQNPAQWKGNLPQRWSVQIRVRLPQQVREYTSVQVNWTTGTLVFTNPPKALDKKPTGAVVGLDVGIAHTITTSDGAFHDAPTTDDLDAKIAYHSKAMAKSRHVNNPTGARNWTPTKGYTRHRQARAQAHAAKTRRLDDWRHKTTTELVRTHDLIAIEALNVANMSRSAKGTLEAPGTNVAAKAGLNRSLAQAAFGTLRDMLAYKTDALISAGYDQRLLAVPPKNTSRRCRSCGHTAGENRKNQAVFACTKCDHRANADINAAGNILDRSLNLWGWTQSPAGSQGKTEPSTEVQAHGPGGTGVEPRTTHTPHTAE